MNVRIRSLYSVGEIFRNLLSIPMSSLRGSSARKVEVTCLNPIETNFEGGDRIRCEKAGQTLEGRSGRHFMSVDS